jgi:FkbM family methyltransferase
MLKTLTKKILGYFDLSVNRKSNQDRIDRDYRTLRREYKQLQKVLFSVPWSRYWALLPQEERDFVAPYLAYSKAQNGQDLFALVETRRNPNRKFFVEFGAADGVTFSNTWFLEKKLRWDGILAEPAQVWHETLKESRSCSIDTRCVATRTGDSVAFREVFKSDSSSPELSSMASCADNGDWASQMRLKNSREYFVETISLNDLLQSHGAPDVIDYMSVDTEGSELDILSSFDFGRYEVRVITVEHNYNLKVRAAIFDLLSSNGFTRKHSDMSRWDDWYVSAGLSR